MMSGASMWLEARADDDAIRRSPAAATSRNALRSVSFISLSCVGLNPNASISAEYVELGRQQRRVERFGSCEPAARLRPPTSGRRDGARVQKEAGVPSIRREGTFHRGPGFLRTAGGRERPRASVLREDVLTHQQLAFGQCERLLGVDAASCEEEGKRARIRFGAACYQVALNDLGLLIEATAPQRVDQRPLVFRQGIEPRGLAERFDGMSGSIELEE